MCTFNSELEMPKLPKSGNSHKTPITLFLKPGDYRFRLLKFQLPDKNDRSYPFIERHIHDHWSVDDKGHKLPDDTVVCPKYDIHTGSFVKKGICPMCEAAEVARKQLTASGFKDPVSRAKYNAMRSKYQAIIPVYVVKEPPRPVQANGKVYTDEGKLKCFMFTEKKVDRSKEKKCPPELNNPNYILCYDDFHAAIQAKISEIISSGGGYSIWNGKNAVDLVLRVSEIPIVYNRGTDKEYTYNKKVITKMVWSKTPYDIDAINKEAIDGFQFDDQYYVRNSTEEVVEFMNNNYGVPSANIPDDDINLDDELQKPTPTPKVSVANNTPASATTPVDINDLGIDDMDPLPSTSSTKDPLETDPDDLTDDNLEDLMNDFDNI